MFLSPGSKVFPSSHGETRPLGYVCSRECRCTFELQHCGTVPWSCPSSVLRQDPQCVAKKPDLQSQQLRDQKPLTCCNVPSNTCSCMGCHTFLGKDASARSDSQGVLGAHRPASCRDGVKAMPMTVTGIQTPLEVYWHMEEVLYYCYVTLGNFWYQFGHVCA